MKGLTQLQISFPMAVQVSDDDLRVLSALADEICRRHERANPGRVMWPFGQGYKMLCHPIAIPDGEPIPFDENVYEVECSERADWAWPCAKCGIEQGEHQGHILEPKAGACDFEPAKKDLGPEPERGVVPMHVYLSAVKGRQDMRQALKDERAKLTWQVLAKALFAIDRNPAVADQAWFDFQGKAERLIAAIHDQQPEAKP